MRYLQFSKTMGKICLVTSDQCSIERSTRNQILKGTLRFRRCHLLLLIFSTDEKHQSKDCLTPTTLTTKNIGHLSPTDRNYQLSKIVAHPPLH